MLWHKAPATLAETAATCSHCAATARNLQLPRSVRINSAKDVLKRSRKQQKWGGVGGGGGVTSITYGSESEADRMLARIRSRRQRTLGSSGSQILTA